jgi:hypothetical protein
MFPTDRTASSFARLAGGVVATLLLVAGCVSAGAATPSAGPTVSPSEAATVSPVPIGSPAPSGSSSASGFYLQAWRTQALPPPDTFGWLPSVTIADGQYIDGMVAIPTIYPGPIYTGLSTQSISAKGIDEIVAEARKDGLLGATADFGGAMAGGVVAHIELTVDGATYDLTGPLPADATETSDSPGTAAAFGAFWNRLGDLAGWLGAELGQSSPYAPASIAVLLTPPTDATSGITPKETPWPLSGTFATFGSPYGGQDRCAVVSGADLGKLLPVVQASNALTRFIDSSGAKESLLVRVLLPGESSPCG